MISHRAQRIKPSATLAMATKAKALITAGEDVINLTAGEPDFAMPEAAQAAIIDAASRGENAYTPAAGMLTLRQRIADYSVEKYGHEFSAKQVIVSSGAKQALYTALLALVNPGDEVIIPAPFWVSYTAMVEAVGGVPKVIYTTLDQGFKLNADQLKQAITARTKAIILNSPSNPSGVVYKRQDLESLALVLDGHPDISVISDDIYDELRFDKLARCNFFDVRPDRLHNGLMIHGISKSFAMTGWRLGWAIGAEDIIAAMIRFQSQCVGNTSLGAQWAAMSCLDLKADYFENLRSIYQARRDDAVKLMEHAGLSYAVPQGAFYIFPDVSKWIQAAKLENATQFAQHILEKAHVAGVSGAAFGAPMCMRLSLTTPTQRLGQAFERIIDVLS